MINWFDIYSLTRFNVLTCESVLKGSWNFPLDGLMLLLLIGAKLTLALAFTLVLSLLSHSISFNVLTVRFGHLFLGYGDNSGVLYWIRNDLIRKFQFFLMYFFSESIMILIKIQIRIYLNKFKHSLEIFSVQNFMDLNQNTVNSRFCYLKWNANF